jgi:hypothetical protein
MPLKKLLFKPGVNRENTRYYNEGGYWESEKVRFRQGTPEKIGGWQRISTSIFLGVCRSLWNWVTLGGLNLIGVGTNLKFYIESGGTYTDQTPIRTTTTLNGPFTSNGTTTVTVTDATAVPGMVVGDFVTFSNATTVGGVNLNGEYQVQSIPSSTTYTITAASAVSAVVGGGGTAVGAMYQINVGSSTSLPIIGWGAGGWGLGTWGNGSTTNTTIRLWSQNNFGEDLIFAPRLGNIYYWDATKGVNPVIVTISVASPAVITASRSFTDGMAVQFSSTGTLPTGLTAGTVYYVVNASGVTFNVAATAGGVGVTTTVAGSGTISIESRGIALQSMAYASDAPTIQSTIIVSDTSRFVMAMGCNDYGATEQNQMLIRWSDQESAVNWTPTATNQAGSLQLSHGSKIVGALQSRQEILVWTDSSLYSLQYLGPPIVWGSQLLSDNISIVSQNATAFSAGVVYWMGVDKFYKYDGRTQTLRCDLRQYVYSDINLAQADQFFASTNEGFNEVWFFYCSADSTAIDRYVVYNYLENNNEGVWYYGTLGRTAWLDSGLRSYPIAATYSSNLVNHEQGLNDNETGTELPIDSYILSTEFDIEDGDRFGFVWRMVPDLTFRGSTASSPSATLYLYPLQNSGSGYNNPLSEGGQSYANVVGTKMIPVEEFTGQVYTRVRGRQMAFKIECNQLGTQWQLGAPRIDIRQDGRR